MGAPLDPYRAPPGTGKCRCGRTRNRLTIVHARWSAAPAARAGGVRLARGDSPPLSPLPPGDAGPQASLARAARGGEARVRLRALRDALRLEARAPPAGRRLVRLQVDTPSRGRGRSDEQGVAPPAHCRAEWHRT